MISDYINLLRYGALASLASLAITLYNTARLNRLIARLEAKERADAGR